MHVRYEHEQELYCQTFSVGKFFDVNKKEVLEISIFVLWKSLNFWSEKVYEPCLFFTTIFDAKESVYFTWERDQNNDTKKKL